MDEMRWFRVHEHMRQLRAEAASDRLARNGRQARVTRAFPAVASQPRPVSVAAKPRVGLGERPCLEGDPC